MRAVAHSPEFAKKVGVPQSVGKDFNKADKRMKKFKDGGSAKPDTKPKPKPKPDDYRAVLGSTKDIVGRGNRTPYEPIPGSPDATPTKPLGRMGKLGFKSGGKTMKKYDDGGEAKGGKAKKMAKGGSTFRSSADGIAKKGKTRGLMPKMADGGEARGGKMKKGCK